MARPPWGRIAGLAALALLILASYEAARPPIESLFLSLYGSEALPRVWLGVALGATAVVMVYNRFAARVPILTLLAASSLLSGLVLSGLLLAGDALPGAGYALYIFKDIYIVVVLEAFWTYANATFDRKTARWIYGGLLVAGTCGSLLGSTAAKVVIEAYGTDASVWLAAPLLGLVGLIAAAMQRTAPSSARPPSSAKPSFGQGFGVVRQSDYLGLILLLLLAVQLTITLVDYQFNALVEVAYPDKDLRSVFKADMYQVLNLVALVLQAGAGVVLLLGVGRVFVALPALTGIAIVTLAIHPVVLVAMGTKIAVKAFDYSLFRASKEILYIPLTYAEKTQGKAVIDMLTYRVAKGGAALLLQGLLAIGAAGAIGWLSVGLVGIWAGLAVVIARRYHARTAGA